MFVFRSIRAVMGGVLLQLAAATSGREGAGNPKEREDMGAVKKRK